jgi:hypothetical protein
MRRDRQTSAASSSQATTRFLVLSSATQTSSRSARATSAPVRRSPSFLPFLPQAYYYSPVAVFASDFSEGVTKTSTRSLAPTSSSTTPWDNDDDSLEWLPSSWLAEYGPKTMSGRSSSTLQSINDSDTEASSDTDDRGEEQLVEPAKKRIVVKVTDAGCTASSPYPPPSFRFADCFPSSQLHHLPLHALLPLLKSNHIHPSLRKLRRRAREEAERLGRRSPRR